MADGGPDVGRELPAAFRAAERRGLEIAAWARIVALLAVEIWLLLALFEIWTLYFHALIGTLITLGLVQIILLRRGSSRPWLKYVFATFDAALLAAILIIPNPLLPEAPPPALALRFSNVIFFFVLLAGAALSYTPGLVLWTGMTATIAWLGGVFWLTTLDGVITQNHPDFVNATGLEARIEAFMRPDLIHLNIQIKKAFVMLLVTGLLAVAVSRARRLALNQVTAERARTNLARYFSPNLVDQLAGQDQPFPIRRQAVAVLFADIWGFTSLCERMSPEAVVDMLRAFFARMERAVFNNRGTIDKYTGDGLMATFGVPTTTALDASSALACARNMLDELDGLNREREAAGQPPLRIGIGIHYGSVVAGDVGGGRRFEYTVHGDAVNVASRLEALTRTLDALVVVSNDLVQRLSEEDPDSVHDLTPAPAQSIRGRAQKLPIWTLKPPDRLAQDEGEAPLGTDGPPTRLAGQSHGGGDGQGKES